MTIKRCIPLDKMIFCPEEKIQSKTQIWHTVFSVFNAIQPLFILFLVTRVCGSEQAGVCSLAFSVANLMIMIANYGVGNYQATDVSFRYEFREYRLHRWATCGLMVFTSIGYVKIRGYQSDKAYAVLLCCLLKLMESVENLYRSEYQRANRLDVAGKVSTIRIVVSTVVFIIVLLLSKSLVQALLYMNLTVLTLIISLLVYTFPLIRIVNSGYSGDWKQIFLVCLPLFLCTFFYTYVCNASKYALDRFASEDMQAYYGMIYAPVSAIYLISNCIYGPFLVRLAGYWKNNQMKPLKNFVKMQTNGILIIGLVVSVGGYLVGTPVLSLIFGTDLKAYKLPLAILLAGSAMTAMVDFSSNILTVIRKQNIQMLIYGAFAATAFLCTGPLVYEYGITGASIAYSIAMTGQAAVLMLFVYALLRRGNERAINKNS